MDMPNSDIIEQALYFVLFVGAAAIGLFMGGVTLLDKLKSYFSGGQKK